MSTIYLPTDASKSRVKAAEDARKNRAEILAAYSHGQISRRDLMKLGLFTAAGMLAPIPGLNPFVPQARADGIPTGAPRSPLFGVQPFAVPMCRFDIMDRRPISSLNPTPTAESNQTQQPVDPRLVGGKTGLMGPIEGRPPGADWAHQRFDEPRFAPQVAIEASQGQAGINQFDALNVIGYNPGCDPSLNNDINPRTDIALCFSPGQIAPAPTFPNQNPANLWTFGRTKRLSDGTLLSAGTIPPKLVQGRYGEPILFRHHNELPFDGTANAGFGRNTISTHEHNGHHGAENDGFTGAYFFPGQFYDYHWPIVLAGLFSGINEDATDPRAGSPADDGGINKVPGDWHETMSTHWFHDHMFSFTSQNVYKGNAAMFNIYSALDRGAEDIIDGVNLRLPSGRATGRGVSWGIVDYDVNIMLADKAWDRDGQLFMDIFDFDGFLGDAMTVNLCFKPFFNVEPRKYRFRILNASVSRFFKVAMCDASGKVIPITQIANDGNLFPSPVRGLASLDEQGIAERYDIVVDFSPFNGQKVYFVNLCEHQDGKKPSQDLSLSEALSGKSSDPCVGKFLEFRVVVPLKAPDTSVVPDVMIPNPDLSNIPAVRQRVFEFGSGGNQNTNDPVTSFIGPWGIKTDNRGDTLNADFGRISAAPRFGTREIWTLQNGGGGWDHPVHIHFEEGQILARNGSARNVPAWEKGRKDVYRLRPGGSVTLTMQFRDWGGMFMEHCHNTVHEDNAMLLRWEISGQTGQAVLSPLPTPIPSPTGVTFRKPDQILSTAF
jgi:FtsP/CotA-like multicopper oxidase with cupredoxin domain